MILAIDFSDLPADAIGILLLLVISFLGWLKGRFSKPEVQEEFVDEEEERMRDIVWRRQVGQDDGERAPWETDPTVWHPQTAAAPPPMPATPPRSRPAPPPPPLPAFQKPKPRQITEKERILAEAFEHRAGRPRSRRSRSSFGRALREPGALRRSVVLAEVLGPPVSLREPGERHP